MAKTGTQGQIRLRLGRKLIPKRLLLEHASLDSLSNAKSAPKAIELWTVSEPPILLLHSVFDPLRLGRTVFPVTFVLRDAVEVVELRVLSNWGQRDFTCVYHVGIF